MLTKRNVHNGAQLLLEEDTRAKHQHLGTDVRRHCHNVGHTDCTIGKLRKKTIVMKDYDWRCIKPRGEEEAYLTLVPRDAAIARPLNNAGRFRVIRQHNQLALLQNIVSLNRQTTKTTTNNNKNNNNNNTPDQQIRRHASRCGCVSTSNRRPP
jgi:hypothetical protein